MTFPRRYRVLSVLAIVTLAACSRHGDFPPGLVLVEAPAPTNVAVTTSDNIVYDVSWGVSDSTLVAFFRVYNLDPFTGAPALLDSTVTRAVQINTLIPTPGIVFGVSSVSVGNVESTITFASSP